MTAAIFSWPSSVPGLPSPLAPLSTAGSAFTGGAVHAVLDGMASYLVGGARSVLRAVTGLVGAPTPRLAATWFTAHLSAMVALAAVLVVPMLAAASIGAVLRQDMARLGRTWGVYLPVAAVGGSAVVPLTGEALRVTDAMSNAITYRMGVDVPRAIGRVGAMVAGAATTGGGGVFVAGLLAFLVVLGGVCLWLELLLRSAAIYVAVFFLPLALAGLVWPATSHWARRCVHLLAALLLSKFVIVGALTVGVGALAATGGRPLDGALMGGAVLLMAAFAPFLLLRLAPMVETAAIAHLEGASRRPVQALRSAAMTAAGVHQNPAVTALASAYAPSPRVPTEEPVVMRDLAALGGDLDVAGPPAPPPSSREGHDGNP